MRARTIITAAQLSARIAALGAEITRAYAAHSQPLTVLALLKGSVYFAADLTRQIALPMRLEFLTVSSYYDGTTSSGSLHCPEHAPDLARRHLLLLDDILDTGLTLSAIRRKLQEETGALSLRTAVLLRKRKPQSAEADWVGFDIEDEFVVGYGLDYAQDYRNLPEIAVLET